MVRRPGRWWVSLLVFLVLFGGVAVMHRHSINARPFAGDSLVVLDWASHAQLRDTFVGHRGFDGEWRPVAFSLIWLEYHLWGVRPLAPYILLNMAVWAAALWVLYQVAHDFTRSHATAWLASALVATDASAGVVTNYLTGHHYAISVALGWASWLYLLRREALVRLRAVDIAVLAALLLASSLSKEMGLAFPLALVAWGVIRKRGDLVAPALLALGCYAALRLAAGAGSTLCFERGYFHEYRTVCLNRPSVAALTQVGYNVAAGAIDSVIGGFFTEDGLLTLAPRRVMFSLAVLPLAVLGWRRRPQGFAFGALLMGAGALLNFPIFATRDTIVGRSVLAVAIAVGAGAVIDVWRERRRWWYMGAAAGLSLGLLVSRGRVVVADTLANVTVIAVTEPCAGAATAPQPVDLAFARSVRVAYGLGSEDCPVGADADAMTGALRGR